MSLLPIITMPDPLLRQVSEPVADITNSTQRLIDDMLETMYNAPGIGLAAIQVGIPKRLLVVDASEDKDQKQPLALINPEIVKRSDTMRVYEEGCLSIPDVRVDVERPDAITVRYIDRNGKPVELDAEGLLATVIQHEVDHLDGQLIVDYLSRLKRDMIIRKFKKQQRAST